MVAIEGLHIANYKSVMANKIKDALIRSSRFNMSHIFFYADDVVFLCDWCHVCVDNIVQVLNDFYLASKLKLNIHKSSLYGVKVT